MELTVGASGCQLSIMEFGWLNRTERQRVSGEITGLYVELSTRCNLSCASCPRNFSQGMRRTHMSEAVFRRVLHSIRETASIRRVVLIGYGEAACHPRFPEYLQRLGDTGARITLVTNGHLVSPDHAEIMASIPLEETVFSWDDAAGLSSAELRTGANQASLERGIRAIREAKEARRTRLPVIGLETVARRSNAGHIRGILSATRKMGVEKWYISNLFPYDSSQGGEILYAVRGKPSRDLRALLKKELGEMDITLAGQKADVPRRCPFMEKGSVFITATGDIAPCMELAYTHGAVYFGNPRTHHRHHFGSIGKVGLASIWESAEFTRFRETFLYWDFPDCSSCYDPGRCYNRTDLAEDCYGNPTPCGECLWAKGVVICP